jgi:uncharacterized protein (TIGR02596 family)
MTKPPRARAGLSLVELLLVLAVMAILIGLAIPASTSLLRGSSLTGGGQSLARQLSLAQQYARARNCLVEFRIYQLPDPTTPSATTPTVYRAFQSFSVSSDGATFTPITKIINLPTPICVVNNATYSSILNPGTAGSPPFYVTGSSTGVSLGIYPSSSYNYIAFHFKPDGSTDLNPISSSWFLSLASLPIQGAAGLPATNFVTLQVNATTGQVAIYRPN